jgi:hypothetical protein
MQASARTAPSTQNVIALAVHALARGILIATAISVACGAVMGGRYLMFEYGHGNREMVMRLLDHLL